MIEFLITLCQLLAGLWKTSRPSNTIPLPSVDLEEDVDPIVVEEALPGTPDDPSPTLKITNVLCSLMPEVDTFKFHMAEEEEGSSSTLGTMPTRAKMLTGGVNWRITSKVEQGTNRETMEEQLMVQTEDGHPLGKHREERTADDGRHRISNHRSSSTNPSSLSSAITNISNFSTDNNYCFWVDPNTSIW